MVGAPGGWVRPARVGTTLTPAVESKASIRSAMRGNLVRRLLGLCAVAMMVFEAFAVAQNGAPATRPIIVTPEAYPSWSSYASDRALPAGPLTVSTYALPRATGAGTP